MPDSSSEHIGDQHQDNSSDTDQDAPAAEEKSSAQPAWRILQLALVSVIALVAVGVGTLLLIIGVLQTNWGTAHVSDIVLNLANPYTESHLSAEEVRGNWIRSLDFYGISLYREDEATQDTVHMAELDSLHLSYNLLGLLRRTIHIREISASGLQAHARQNEDESWDLFDPFIPEEEDTTATVFALRIDDINLNRIQAAASFYPLERDSTFYLTELRGQVDDLYISETRTSVNLQRLNARFIPPAENIERELKTSFTLADRSLDIHHLDLESPYSNLSGNGLLFLPGEEDDYIDEVDFRLTAAPLDFRDLAGLVPDIDPDRSAEFELYAEGSERLIDLTVGATLSDGATIDVQGSFTPVRDAEGRLIYSANASVRDLNPFFFTSTGDEPASRITADLSADLEGPSLQEINGPLQLEIYEGVWDTYTVSQTVFAADFTNGQADMELSGGIQGATLQASGTMQPFEPEPIYDLQFHFANLDLQRFNPQSETSTNLTGTLSLDGQGIDLQSADVNAQLDLSPSSINQYNLTRGQLQAHLQDGSLTFNTNAASPQGAFQARGQADNLDNVPGYRIESGRLDNVDMAALAGDTTRSEITAQFSLTGQGTSAQDLVIERAQIQMQDSFYGHYNIQTASLNAALRNGLFNVNGSLDMADAGMFDLQASARPFAAERPWSISRATFVDADIGILTRQPGQSSSLNGSLQAEGRGATTERLQAEGIVELDSSRLNQQTINSASLVASLNRGFLEYNLGIHLPEGTTRLAGTAEPFADPITYAASGNIEGLNIGALLAQPGFQTDLYGDIKLEGTGTDPADMDLQASAQLEQSRINRETISDGELSVQVSEGIGRINTQLSFANNGSFIALFDANFTEDDLSYEGAANLYRLRLGRIAGADTLDAQISADAQFSGRGTDPETMFLSGSIVSSQAYYNRLYSDGVDLDFVLDDGLLQVEDFRLETNIARASGSGQIALFETAAGEPSDFRLSGYVQSLDPLRSYLEVDVFSVRENEFSARIFGPYNALRFDVRTEGESLVYNEIRMTNFDASLVGQLDAERNLDLAEVEGTFGYVSLPQFTTQRIDLEASYQDDEVSFLADLVIDDFREAYISGVAELHPDRQFISFDTFDVRLDENEWELLQEASITYNDVYRVRNFLIYSDDQQIAVDGAIDLQGEQSLALTVENFRIGSVADLLGYDGLDGRMNGNIDLSGLASSPTLQGALSLDLISDGRAVGDLQVALDYDDLQLNIDSALEHEDGSRFTANGYLPMDLRFSAEADTVAVMPELVSQREMRLSVDADSFAVDWIRPFVDEETISRIEGRLSARLDIEGTPGTPDLSGTALLSNGLLSFPDLGTTFRSIQANLEFTDDRVHVRRASMRSGDGRLDASGTINMTALTLGEYDVDIRANNFLALDTPMYRARADATINLRGTTAEPYLEGGLRVISGDVYLGDELTGQDVEEVQLTDADLRIVEQRFGTRITEADTTGTDFYEAMGMNIDLRIERDVWLRSRSNPNMDVQFTGSLDLQKNHGQDLQLFGSIEVVPERSRISQFGRRFDITEGSITFNGPIDDPMFDIHAEYEVPSRRNREGEAIITLALSGRMDDLDLTLGSSPPGLDGTDIASYLITGRPASSGFLGGGGTQSGPGGLAGDIALGQISSMLETAAGAELGLDVMEIEQDNYRGITTITAGSYVSPRLFLAVSQPIALGSPLEQIGTRDAGYTQITIEYELQRWLLLRLLSRNFIEINLLWEYAY